MRRCALAAALLLATAACGGVEAVPADEGRRVSGHGLAVELPPRWHGDVSKPDPGTAPLLRLATFPLAEPATDLGQSAQGTLRPGDILVSVVDYGRLPGPSALPTAATPIRVERSHVASFEGFREPVLTRSFELDGHALQLWVVAGASIESEEVLERANAALATLAVLVPDG